jgi:hypothetical protein
MARAVCVYLRYAVDHPERAGVLVRVHADHAAFDSPLNQGLVEDISKGLAAGRFQVATIESAVLYVMGVTHAALSRVTEEPSLTLAVSLAQQMSALLLRGLGVAGAEPEILAAQAADEIVRRGAFSDAVAAT